MKEVYEKYERCVVQIAVKGDRRNPTIGTGFHIGDGYIVTARYVVGMGKTVLKKCIKGIPIPQKLYLFFA